MRVSIALTLVLMAVGAAAQSPAAPQRWNWPEKPENLKVLQGFTGQRLAPVMKGFTRALGVRCTYCHVGEEGKPLSTYDFVSDKNPNKDRARAMLRMLGTINEQLAHIQPSGDKRVNMWCHTCHAGRPRPMTLEEDLGETYRKAGLPATLTRYRELRERYYGKGGYDFSERSLSALASELLGKGDREAAIGMFRLVVTEFPGSAAAWDSLAAAYLEAGRTRLAAIYFRKSLELDPQNEGALSRLREIESKPLE